MRTVGVFPGVLSLILSRSAYAGQTEIGGFLIGKMQRKKLYVTRATFPRQTGSMGYVSINDVDMALLAEELEKRGTGEVIIGWWHTHPGMGAHFMSGTDIATQQRYQAFFPQAIAMVVDPLRFSESLNLGDLDLHIYRTKNGRLENLGYAFVHDPKKIIPDFYNLLLTLEAPTHVILEETWFERLIREIFGQQITTPEFVQFLGQFIEVAVTISAISVLFLIILLSLMGLVS